MTSDAALPFTCLQVSDEQSFHSLQSISNTHSECQQPSPQPRSCYASAPNDVWSLGVILVNLTCGRNPWKRASTEDSTFRAFMKDGSFLKSILPISDDLDYILRRVFELNSSQRIGLHELRELIIRCPSFTNTPSAPAALPSPPYSPEAAARDMAWLPVQAPAAAFAQLPPTKYRYPLAEQSLPERYSQMSTSSNGSAGSDTASIFSAGSSHSSNSSTSSLNSYTTYQPQPPLRACAAEAYYAPSNQPWWGQIFPSVMNFNKHASFIPARVF